MIHSKLFWYKSFTFIITYKVPISSAVKIPFLVLVVVTCKTSEDSYDIIAISRV